MPPSRSIQPPVCHEAMANPSPAPTPAAAIAATNSAARLLPLKLANNTPAAAPQPTETPIQYHDPTAEP